VRCSQRFTLGGACFHPTTSLVSRRVQSITQSIERELTMKLRCLLVVLVAVVLVVGAEEEKKPALKGDLKKLQGTWKATSITYNGDDVSTEGKGAIKLMIKGDMATVEADKSVKRDYAKLKITLDEKTKPKIFDINVQAGGQKGITMESIYKLEGDKLTICTRVLGSDRPAKFESPAGESIALVVLERVKK
jgi:uncharacterized protein (TIGR03067 family)